MRSQNQDGVLWGPVGHGYQLQLPAPGSWTGEGVQVCVEAGTRFRVAGVCRGQSVPPWKSQVHVIPQVRDCLLSELSVVNGVAHMLSGLGDAVEETVPLTRVGLSGDDGLS